MKALSIFNQVQGPVMRGPSGSHTVDADRIASMARSFLSVAPSAQALKNRCGQCRQPYANQK